jgi:hypothetical protein
LNISTETPKFSERHLLDALLDFSLQRLSPHR